MRIAHVTVPDLYAYREEIRPVIDKITKKRERVITIKVDRNKIYEEASRRFVSKIKELENISLRQPEHELPVIEFLDIDELDVDGSGFRREYYAVYFRKCIAHLFEGNGRQMLPKKDSTMKDELTALGIAIVECILNGDCGFPYLNVAIFKTIIGCDPDDLDQYLSIDDLPESEVKLVSQQINDASTENQLGEIVTSNEAIFISYIGWPTENKITLSNKHVLLSYILRWYIIDHRQNEIEQLRHGLKYMGFLDTIKSNPWFEPLFVYSGEYSITANYMREKLNTKIDELESKNDSERMCKTFAKACIESLNDNEARLLFAFITNLYDPPIEEESFQVRFNRHNPTRTLPESYTCLNRLVLPLGNKSIDQFKESFRRAIMEQDF